MSAQVVSWQKRDFDAGFAPGGMPVVIHVPVPGLRLPIGVPMVLPVRVFGLLCFLVAPPSTVLCWVLSQIHLSRRRHHCMPRNTRYSQV